MQNQRAPNLFNVVDKIEINSKFIASQWVKIRNINLIFHAHKISPQKFRDKFAIPIIEFFCAVIREKKSAGDCPIMTKFVHFMLEKGISPKDVFDICMGLRRTIISYLFKEKLIQGNALETMDEMATLFDANLSGVLNVFTTFYKEQQKNIEVSESQQKKYNQILKIINFINTKIVIVQNSRIIMCNKSFFEIIAIKNIQELYKRYEDGFSFMTNINCDEKECDLKKVDKWLSQLNNSKKPFTTDIYHQKYGKVFTYSGRVTILPDSNPIQYIITLNNIASHLDKEEELQEKLSHDKLTGLYSYAKFEHLIGEAQRIALNEGTNLALSIVDIPKLKEINENQGYDAGDRVIIEVAEDIRSHADDSMILAHLEGSRFGILMPYESEQACYDWCHTLSVQLNTKTERKTVSVTGFDLTEKINRLLMRAYDLADMARTAVHTDFENIDLYDILPEQDIFIEQFKDIDKIDTSLYFKSLPILSENKLISINQDDIALSISNKQLAIAHIDDTVYLRLTSLGAVQAKIGTIDPKNKIFTIHKFRFDEHSPLDRKKFRIEAKENLPIKVVSSGGALNGIVLNFNQDHIALVLKNKKRLHVGDLVSVIVFFEIENLVKPFNTHANIERIEKVKEGFKIVLACNFDTVNKKLLSDYLAHRQREVIQELQNI